MPTRDLLDRVLADRRQELLDGVIRTQGQFILEHSPREVFAGLLRQLIDLSQSEFGFIGELVEDTDRDRFLRVRAMTDISWNEESRTLATRAADQGLEFHNLDNLFGWVVEHGRPLLSDDPSNDPRAGGLPNGHPPLRSFMGVPLRVGDAVVGMVGLANRPGGFDDALLVELEPAFLAAAHICHAVRCAQARRRAEELAESVIAGLADPVVVIDRGYRVILSNQAAGPSRPITPGQRCYEALHGSAGPCSGPDSECPLAQVLATGETVTVEHVHQQQDGERRWVEILVSPLVLGGEVEGVIECSRDITDRKRTEAVLRMSEERYRHLASHDALTGLPNRTLLYDRLSHAVSLADRTGSLVAVMFLDLDGFKEVNDRFGHRHGDSLLQAVARRLEVSTRESDTIARLGGDEFAVVMEGIANREAAIGVARKIIGELKRPFMLEPGPVSVTGSIGVAFYPADGVDSDELLNRADDAMYDAKEGGGARVTCFGEGPRSTR